MRPQVLEVGHSALDGHDAQITKHGERELEEYNAVAVIVGAKNQNKSVEHPQGGDKNLWLGGLDWVSERNGSHCDQLLAQAKRGEAKRASHN